MSGKPTKRLPTTPAEKLEAIRRVTDGESKASVARDIGVPESTLRGWCKNEEKIRQQLRQSPTVSETGDNGLEVKKVKLPTPPRGLDVPVPSTSSTPNATHALPVPSTSAASDNVTGSVGLNLTMPNKVEHKSEGRPAKRMRHSYDNVATAPLSNGNATTPAITGSPLTHAGHMSGGMSHVRNQASQNIDQSVKNWTAQMFNYTLMHALLQQSQTQQSSTSSRTPVITNGGLQSTTSPHNNMFNGNYNVNAMSSPAAASSLTSIDAPHNQLVKDLNKYGYPNSAAGHNLKNVKAYLENYTAALHNRYLSQISSTMNGSVNASNTSSTAVHNNVTPKSVPFSTTYQQTNINGLLTTLPLTTSVNNGNHNEEINNRLPSPSVDEAPAYVMNSDTDSEVKEEVKDLSNGGIKLESTDDTFASNNVLNGHHSTNNGSLENANPSSPNRYVKKNTAFINRNATKPRSALNDIFARNDSAMNRISNGDNGVSDDDCSYGIDLSTTEALNHATIFCRWLENRCSDPAVTRTMINNYKTLLHAVADSLLREDRRQQSNDENVPARDTERHRKRKSSD